MRALCNAHDRKHQNEITRMLNVYNSRRYKKYPPQKFSWLPHPPPLIGITVGPSLDPCSSLPWRTSPAARSVSTAFFPDSDWVLFLHNLFLLLSCALRYFVPRDFARHWSVCFDFRNGGLSRDFKIFQLDLVADSIVIIHSCFIFPAVQRFVLYNYYSFHVSFIDRFVYVVYSC